MTLIMVASFLALLILVVLLFVIRQRQIVPARQVHAEQAHTSELQKDKEATAHDAPVNWEKGWRTAAWSIDKDAYKAIDKRSSNMFIPVASRIRSASKLAAIAAFKQATETNAPVEAARKAALDAYSLTADRVHTDECWQEEWQKKAWDVDGDAYRAVAVALDDGDGYLKLASLLAVTRVIEASKGAAITAYRQAQDSGQSGEASRKLALEAYSATFAAELAEEQAQQANRSTVGQRLAALSLAQITQIEQRMYPNDGHGAGDHAVTSVSGFLQAGERLLTVIANDEQTLHNLGITPEQVADCLELYVARTRRRYDLAGCDQIIAQSESSPVIDGPFAITFQSYRGAQACPFEDSKGRICGSSLYGDVDFTIRNRQTNEILRFPGLIIHLIREHHFFEGTVDYRVDPRRAVKVLELQPGIDYRPRYKRMAVWRCKQGTAISGEAELQSFTFLQAIRDNPITVISVDETTHLYVRGDHCLAMAEHACPLPPEFMVADAAWDSTMIHPGVWGFERSNEMYVDLL